MASLADVSKKPLHWRHPSKAKQSRSWTNWANDQTSSHDVRKDGDDEDDVTLVDTPAGDCSPPVPADIAP